MENQETKEYLESTCGDIVIPIKLRWITAPVCHCDGTAAHRGVIFNIAWYPEQNLEKESF